ncbi:MAG TPA: type II toxin-antitoxin system YafQ family toxin [Campylobacterales bacterium]|nr:type II toxin-antitoxin system YafQ family toxin [Campylobacterales bacterium]
MLNFYRGKIFLKEYKKIKFTDKLYLKYLIYVGTLLKEEPLPPEAKDHPLKGKFSDYREFHISGDLLLVYRVKDETLQLIRIGSHSEIFG